MMFLDKELKKGSPLVVRYDGSGFIAKAGDVTASGVTVNEAVKQLEVMLATRCAKCGSQPQDGYTVKSICPVNTNPGNVFVCKKCYERLCLLEKRLV